METIREQIRRAFPDEMGFKTNRHVEKIERLFSQEQMNIDDFYDDPNFFRTNSSFPVIFFVSHIDAIEDLLHEKKTNHMSLEILLKLQDDQIRQILDHAAVAHHVFCFMRLEEFVLLNFDAREDFLMYPDQFGTLVSPMLWFSAYLKINPIGYLANLDRPIRQMFLKYANECDETLRTKEITMTHLQSMSAVELNDFFQKIRDRNTLIFQRNINAPHTPQQPIEIVQAKHIDQTNNSQTQSEVLSTTKDSMHSLAEQEKDILETLQQQSYYPPEFIQACAKMSALVVKLEQNKQLSLKDACDVMNKTNALITNPEQYKDFFNTAKKYHNVAGGKLAAYMLLAAGWAFNILTVGLASPIASAWIKFANEKLEQINAVEELANASKNRSSFKNKH